MAKKAYIGVDEYTRLEYIESTGTQYIDTGFKPYAYKHRVVLKFMLVRAHEGVLHLFGNRSTNGTPHGLTVNCSPKSAGATDTVGFSVAGGTSGVGTWSVDASYNVVHTLDISADNGTYTAIWNGATSTGTYTGTFDTTSSVAIFAENRAGYFMGMENGYRLYSLQIYNNQGLVRDYIPVLHESGSVGLYDIAGGKFYPNNGSGTFAAGNATSGKVGIAHKVKRAYVGIENAVPSGYTQVEHIESTGTQYIDTGVSPSSDMKVEVAYTPTAGLGESAIFGSTWAVDGYFLMFYNNAIRWHTGGAVIDIGSYSAGDRVVCVCTNNYIQVDGVQYNVSGGINSTTNISLFNSSGYSLDRKGVGKLEYARMWVGDTLVRDFIPCINPSGAVGLYDRITGTFYGNSGSGVFTAGNRYFPTEYSRVEYLESSGTQYIDTGVSYSDSNTYLTELKVVYNTTSPDNQIMGFNGHAGMGIGSAGATFWECNGHALSAGTPYTLSWTKSGSNYTRIINGSTYSNTNGNTGSGWAGTLKLFAATTSAYDSSMNYYCQSKLYYAKIYVNGALVRDFAPCVKSDGTAGMYDLVGGEFYTNAGSGTFATGAIYQGSTARRVKKAYIGVGGVARPFWGGGTELAYYGTITPLSAARYMLATAKVGDYALFGGGLSSAVVEAYDKKLTRTIPAALSAARFALVGASVGNYALFGGGSTSNVVDAYDASLTRTTPTALSVARGYLASATIGGYALFGGGQGRSASSNVVDAYDASLTRTTPTALSVARAYLAATTVGDHALFGGGYNSAAASRYATVDAYDASLTRTTPTALSVARAYLAATTVGDFALFGGGIGTTANEATTVDAYDKALTRSTPTPLSTGRNSLGATSIGECAIFGCDQNSAVADVYNASLERTIPQAMSVARQNYGTVCIGEYALFGGGQYYQSAYVNCDTVEAYTIV